jgi:hypothetical protein
MQKLGTAVYLDRSNVLHVDATSLCESLGVDATPENVAVVMTATIDVVRERYPNTDFGVIKDGEVKRPVAN